MSQRVVDSLDSSSSSGAVGTSDVVIDLRGDRVSLRDAQVYSRKRGLYEHRIKPIVDVVAALILIIAFSPIMVVSAIAVYLSLGGPVIFKQSRVGLGGRVFDVYKFRTMAPDRRANATRFAGADRRVSHKRADDPRLNRTGAFLRKWSLDELPQFLNVLRGEMSIVGPRPELVGIVANYETWQHQRHSVKPGITGLWQVSERGTTMLHEATELDIQYLDSLSMASDLKILAMTPLVMLGMKPGY